MQRDPESSRGGPAATDRYGMPRWIPRLITIVVLVCIGLFAAFHMLRAVRTLLVLLVIAFFLSIALEPGVNFLNRKGWKRGWATGLIFLVAVLVLGLFIGLMVPLVVGQISNFIRDLPGYVDNLAKFADRFGVEFSSERLREALTGVDTDLQALAADVAGGVFGVGTALLSTVMQILTVALFTFYMTADGPRLRRAMLSLLPAARQREVLWAIEVAIDKQRLLAATLPMYGSPVTAELNQGPYVTRVPPSEYNLEWAGTLLDEAGWKDRNDDGVRECHGCLYAQAGRPLQLEPALRRPRLRGARAHPLARLRPTRPGRGQGPPLARDLGRPRGRQRALLPGRRRERPGRQTGRPALKPG